MFRDQIKIRAGTFTAETCLLSSQKLILQRRNGGSKSSPNIHYAGCSGWWEGLSSFRINSCRGFCLLTTSPPLPQTPLPPSPIWRRWDGECKRKHFRHQRCDSGDLGLCMATVTVVKLHTEQRVSDRYLQSFFSTRYAQIRKPVRLKPCVQWTPSRKRERGEGEKLTFICEVLYDMLQVISAFFSHMILKLHKWSEAFSLVPWLVCYVPIAHQ